MIAGGLFYAYTTMHGQTYIKLHLPARNRVRKTSVVPDVKVKGKSVPLQAWSGPEGSRKLTFPDYVTNGIGWW